MIDWHFYTILLFEIVIIVLYMILLKNTVFGLSIKNANYTGFFLAFELFFYLLPGTLLLNYFSVDKFFVVFKVKQDSVYWISLVILVTYFFILMGLALFSNIFKTYLKINPNEDFKVNRLIKYRVFSFIRFVIVFSFIVMMIVLLKTGAKHAFFESIVNGISISILRAENKQIGFIVKLLNNLFIFIGPFLAIFSGSNVYDKNKLERVFVFISAIILSTYMGSKGPLMTTILAFFISYLTFHRIKISLKNILFVVIFIILLFYLVYHIVTLQYKDMSFDLFLNYFVNRIFIAQIDGVYEQFNLFLQNWKYWLHAIPFVSFFIDYPIFHKDLMMMSEDRIDPTTIGIKNTLFIAEAYAFGGWFMVIVSPLIFTLNLMLTYIWFNILINSVILSQRYTKYIIGLFLFSYLALTGGFSDILFFKLPIMMSIFFLAYIIPYLMYKFLVKNIYKKAKKR